MSRSILALLLVVALSAAPVARQVGAKLVLTTTTTATPVTVRAYKNTSEPQGNTTASVATTPPPPTASAMQVGQEIQLTTTEGDFGNSAPSSIESIEQMSVWLPNTSGTAALVHALLASFSVILVSELGDKTFIITAIMAMKNSRSLVFVSSASALLIMTVLSVCMGVAVTVVPKLYTHYASIVLFVCFGLKMLKEAYELSAENEGDESEFDEVKRSLEVEALDGERQLPENKTCTQQLEEAAIDTRQQVPLKEEPQQAALKSPPASPNWPAKLAETVYVAPIVFKVFTMIFVAEWGDRSQISTVILAAREDVVGVFVGSLSGHLFCTGLAVIGGRFVADMISVRTMTFIGAIIFLFFAVFAIVTGPEL